MDSVEKSKKGKYGFRKDLFNMFRLGLLLNINNKEFQNIRDDLESLRKEYLNILYSASKQRATLQLIESELTKRHPQTFGGQHGPKHLYFAIHVIMTRHTINRGRIRRGKGQKKDNAKSSSKSHRFFQVYEKSSAYPVVSRKIQYAKMSTIRRRTRIRRRQFLDYVSVPTLKKILKTKIAAHRALVRPNKTVPRFNIIDGPVEHSFNVASHDTSVPLDSVSAITPPTWRVILEPDQHHVRPANEIPTIPAPCADSLRLELPSQYTSNISGYSEVQRPYPTNQADLKSATLPSTGDPTAIRHAAIYTFLRTCQPPMMHYLRRFVDFGCVTNTHLRSVSLWRSEQRYNLLKKILRSDPRDAMPSEMDIAVLENHFETYFLED